MVIESAHVHLRNLAILGTGAALLAVIGYFLMKSDLKKPRRRSSKSASSEEAITPLTDTQSSIDTLDLLNKNNDTIVINEEMNSNMTELIRNDTNQQQDLSESTLSSLTSSQMTTKKNDDFELDHQEEEEEENSRHVKEQTNSLSEIDKLSDASSDMYNCINEYEELNHSILENTNSSSTKEKALTSSSSSTDDESTEKKSKEQAPAASQEDTGVVTTTIFNNISNNDQLIDLNQIKIKSKQSSSSSSSSSSASNSSFQAAKPKAKITKNSKINFESKKTKNNNNNNNNSKAVSGENTNNEDINKSRTGSNTRSSNTASSSSNKTSVEDLVVYEFNFPRKYCGKLIGKNGVHVDYIRSKTHTQIAVRNDPNVEDLQIVCVSGRIEDVDAALDIISLRFPAQLYPQISFKPISKPIVYRRFNPEKKSPFEQSKVLVASNMFVQISDVLLKAPNKSSPSAASTTKSDPNRPLSKPIELNVRFPVHVTAIVNATHVFIQLPTHSSYESLQKLDENMIKAYSGTDPSEPVPNMLEPIEHGTICAAPTSYGWHRAMVTDYHPYDEASSLLSLSSLAIGDDLPSLSSGIASVKFLDYGGYLNIAASQLKQLRSDFMLLPFQSIECYLDGIFSYEGTEESGKAFLSHMIKNSNIEACVTGFSADNIPLIKLYISNDLAKGICLNNELEKYGLAYNAFSNDLINSENNSLDYYLDSYTSLPYSSLNNQFSI